MIDRRHLVIGTALVAPLAIAMSCLAAIALAEQSGSAIFGDVPPANLAEAAASGRADDVVRRLRRGEDVRQVYDLRPDVISSSVLRATALEAAMWSRQPYIIRLFDREGVLGDAAERGALACLAADLDLAEIVEYLSPDGNPPCERGRMFERVLARTPRRDDD